MQKSERIVLDAMKEVLAPHGFTFVLGSGGKHPFVDMTAPDGRCWTVTIPCSGRSDATAQGNFARQKARRVLAEFRSGAAAA